MRWWGAQAGGGVRAARADDGRDGNGGNYGKGGNYGSSGNGGSGGRGGRGGKGKTLSEFWDFDKVYYFLN